MAWTRYDAAESVQPLIAFRISLLSGQPPSHVYAGRPGKLGGGPTRFGCRENPGLCRLVASSADRGARQREFEVWDGGPILVLRTDRSRLSLFAAAKDTAAVYPVTFVASGLAH